MLHAWDDAPDDSDPLRYAGSCTHPRITLITLGVDGLERSVAFYRDGLGLQTEGIVGTEFEHS